MSPLCRSCQLFDERYYHKAILYPPYYPMTEEDNCEYYIEKDETIWWNEERRTRYVSRACVQVLLRRSLREKLLRHVLSQVRPPDANQKRLPLQWMQSVEDINTRNDAMKRKDAIFIISSILLLIKTVYNLITETECMPTLAQFAFVLMMILFCENCSKHVFSGDFHKWLNETI